MAEVKTTMCKDQVQCVADLQRKGQSITASRVAALSEVGFEIFKRDLLVRYAADGLFSK